MITIKTESAHERPERVNSDALIRLAAAIERGNASEAFLELDTLLHHDPDCAEFVAQGRVNHAKRTARAVAA